MREPRLFAIPDVHGRHDLLDDLLKTLFSRIKFDVAGGDRCVFLGDMIDRGPDSRLVIDAIRGCVEKFPQAFVALAGNHEWLAIDAYAEIEERGRPGEDWTLWMMNGGGATLKSYGNEVPEDVIRWMRALPLSHKEPGFFFSHAPAPRENRRSIMRKGQPFSREELTWTYGADEQGISRNWGDGTVGVCGHMHALHKNVLLPRFYDHYIFVDAGCGCDDKAPLVAVDVRSRETIFAHQKCDDCGGAGVDRTVGLTCRGCYGAGEVRT